MRRRGVDVVFGGHLLRRALGVGEGPVALEQRQRLHHQRAGEVEAQVVPGGLAGFAFEVLRGQVAPAAPQPARFGRAVDDQHLAVVTQVGAALQRRMQRRHEQHHADAGGAQGLEVRAAGHQAAHAVEQQAHAHAGAGLGAQLVDDLLAQRVAAEDEGAQVDRLLRRVEVLPQRLQRLAAIGMDAAGRGRRPAPAGPAHAASAAPTSRPAPAARQSAPRAERGRASLREPKARNIGSAT